MIAILGDLHGRRYQTFNSIVDGKDARLNDIVSVIEQAGKECYSKGINELFLGGDIFHNRYRIDVPVYHAVWKALRFVSCLGIKLHFIVGNHDLFLRESCKHSSIAPFADIGNVYDEPELIEVDGRHVLALPYDSEITKGFLMDNQIHGKDIVVIGHVEVKGARFATGVKSEKGISVKELKTVLKQEGAKSVICFFAHYHHPSVKKSTIFIGAGLHMDRNDSVSSEEDGDRYLWLLDGKKVSRVPLQFPKFIRKNYDDLEPSCVGEHFYTVALPMGNKDTTPEEIKSQLLRAGARDVEVLLVRATDEADKDAGLAGKEYYGLGFDECVKQYITDYCPTDLSHSSVSAAVKEVMEEVHLTNKGLTGTRKFVRKVAGVLK